MMQFKTIPIDLNKKFIRNRYSKLFDFSSIDFHTNKKFYLLKKYDENLFSEFKSDISNTFDKMSFLDGKDDEHILVYFNIDEVQYINLLQNKTGIGFTDRIFSNSLYEKIYNSSKIFIMGILNITPDSFSDGNRYYERKESIEHAEKMIREGADIIDVGGESSRPGAEPVTQEEELRRVIPVITEIKNKYPDTIISIDTVKPIVAEKALEAGATIVNDISGFNYDKEIIEIVSHYNAVYVLMHIKGSPKIMQVNPQYFDVTEEIFDYFYSKLSILKNKKIDHVIIDPGIGFGKRVHDNYEILDRLNDFSFFRLPVMIGISNKSFIGKSLSIPLENRESINSILHYNSIDKGVKIIRTHDVLSAVRVSKLHTITKNLENINYV